jgi:dihydrolipoamide dehydrogenase
MYDIIVIGAGPAGYEVATLLSNGGKRVCIIEKSEKNIGGTCLNEGCIPAKNFLESSSYIKKNKYFQNCGVKMDILSFDIKQLQTATNNLILDLKTGILTKLKKAKVDIKYGKASFIDKNTININGDNNEIINAKNIVIASGSSHKNHPLIELYEDKVISSREVFTLNDIPQSILIIGAGAIGCEFASFFNALDVDVELAEFTSKIVPMEDDDVSKSLKRELEKQGIKINVNTNIIAYNINNDGIEVEIDYGKKNEMKLFDKILISIGRIPNTKNLNLSNANINENRGFIEVNSNLQSISNDNIYAIGDVISTPALAHVGYYEAKRVAQIILNKEVMSEKTIFPSVTFCTPQVASVGMNEKVLKDTNIQYKSKKIFFKSNAKSKIKGDDSGFIKILYDINTNIILGASIIGNEATEIIHQFLIIINTKQTMGDISKMIFAHPTLSEGILDLM